MFYIFFEGVLIPMFIIIGVWGNREEKISAAYYFFMYTLVGSLVLLISIIKIYELIGTTDYISIKTTGIPTEWQYILWIGFSLSMSVKIPLIPVHIWLPKAHVEAPVAGSVILAGLLLKLGGYGYIRMLLNLFPEATSYYSPFMIILGIIAIVYGSLITLRQTDMKRLIAYSSIAHMGVATVGIFTGTMEGIEGAIYLMIAHGLVSSGLFITVTMIYDRHHTRLIKYYRGLSTTMPLWSTFFMILTFANMGVPLTANFIGELLVLIGTYHVNPIFMIMAGLGVILSAGYSLYFYNRIAFGEYSPHLRDSTGNYDINRRETYVLLWITAWVIILGILPDIVTTTTITNTEIIG